VEATKQYSRTSSPVAAIYRREWKLLLRTPVYVLNGLAGSIIGPMLILIAFAAQGQSEEGRMLSELLSNPASVVPVSLGGLGLMLFTAGMNIVASTAISREGQTFWVAKMIPVTPKEQVMGKFLNAFAIALIGVAVSGIIMLLFLKVSVPRVLIMMILAAVGAAALTAIGLIIDVIHPKLNWSSPTEAMKQNLNGMVAILVAFLFIGMIAGFSVLLVLIGLPEWAIYLLLLIVMSAAAVPSCLVLFSMVGRRYDRLEA
jgi:ABC-2 type transport system permease protein